MFTKKLYLGLSSAFVLISVLGIFTLGPVRSAFADPVLCPDGQTVDIPGVKNPAIACEGHMTAPPSAPGETIYVRNDCNGPAVQAGLAATDENHCGILNYLLQFINFLSALVGVVVVGSIIWGGIQYSSAGGDPQKVSAAKGRIFNSIIALFAYMFIFAFLQYIVPGGIF